MAIQLLPCHQITCTWSPELAYKKSDYTMRLPCCKEAKLTWCLVGGTQLAVFESSQPKCEPGGVKETSGDSQFQPPAESHPKPWTFPAETFFFFFLHPGAETNQSLPAWLNSWPTESMNIIKQQVMQQYYLEQEVEGQLQGQRSQWLAAILATIQANAILFKT